MSSTNRTTDKDSVVRRIEYLEMRQIAFEIYSLALRFNQERGRWPASTYEVVELMQYNGMTWITWSEWDLKIAADPANDLMITVSSTKDPSFVRRFAVA